MADGPTGREGRGRIAGAFGLCLAIAVVGGVLELIGARWWLQSVNPALGSAVSCLWFGPAAALVVGTLIPGRRWSVGLPLVLVTQLAGACIYLFPIAFVGALSSAGLSAASGAVVAGVVAGIAFLAYRQPLERLKWRGCLGIGLLLYAVIVLAAWQHDMAYLSRVDTVMVPSVQRMLAQDVFVTGQDLQWGYPTWRWSRARWDWQNATLCSPVCEVSCMIGNPSPTAELLLDARQGLGVRGAGDLEGLNLSRPLKLSINLPWNATIRERDVRANPELMRSWLRYLKIRPELVARMSPRLSNSGNGVSECFQCSYHGMNYVVADPDQGSGEDRWWQYVVKIYISGRYSSAEP